MSLELSVVQLGSFRDYSQEEPRSGRCKEDLCVPPLAEICPKLFPLCGEASLLSSTLITDIWSCVRKAKLAVGRDLTLLIWLSFSGGQSCIEGKSRWKYANAQ
jgi:hypothetical protein